MTSFIQIPFALGTTLWTPSHDRVETWVQCPECAGTRAITLVQGNGVTVSLDCACCSRGYESASGLVRHCEYLSVPQPFVARRVEMSGKEFRYSEAEPDASCYSHCSASELFPERAACEARCQVLNSERQAEEERRAVANLASKRRDMTWSVHYWGRKVRDLERDLEVARRHLAVCEERRTK